MPRRYLIIGFLVALLALGAGAAYRFYQLWDPSIEKLKQNVNFNELQGTLNLLVLGIDEIDKVHRSDTILLVSIDIDSRRVKAMSIPRDTRVQIKGHGLQKVNHAYAFGGVELLKDTVINLTGVPVNYTAIVNYAAFPKIVDAVGGVEINVAKRMRYTDRAQKLFININPGLQHMNGEEALKFVRFRMDALGDEGRIRRQQQFLKAMVNKVHSPAIIPRLPELAVATLDMVKTDLPKETALLLAAYLKDIDIQDIDIFTMPGSSAYIKGLSYWIPDLQKASDRLNEGALSDDAPPSEPVSGDAQPQEQPLDEEGRQKLLESLKGPVAILNGVGQPGLGKQAAQKMERLGIAVNYTGNAKHFDYRYSVIHYPANQPRPETALALAQLCKIPQNLINASAVPQVSLIVGKDYERIFKILDQLPLQK